MFCRRICFTGGFVAPVTLLHWRLCPAGDFVALAILLHRQLCCAINSAALATELHWRLCCTGDCVALGILFRWRLCSTGYFAAPAICCACDFVVPVTLLHRRLFLRTGDYSFALVLFLTYYLPLPLTALQLFEWGRVDFFATRDALGCEGN